MIAITTRNLSRWITAAVLAAGMIVVTDRASAQFGQAVGFSEMMRPKYVRRDLVLFEEYLSLDEAQKDILKSLFDDYESSFQEGQTRFKDRMSALKTEIENVQDKKRILAVILTPFSELAAENEARGGRFMEDAKLILTAEQLNEWPWLERAMRREKEINGSANELAGEGIDLIVRVRLVKLDSEARRGLEPVLQQYATELDEALKQRGEAVLATRADLIQGLSQDDWDLYERARQTHIQHHIRVRDVNDRYIEAITAALPVGYREEFRQGALEAGYPRVYRETPVQRLFKAALKLEDIGEDTRGQVAALEQLYLAELKSTNETLLAQLRVEDPKDLKNRITYEAERFKNQTVQRPGDSMREAFLERDEMGRRYVEQVHKLLSPEQFASLPGANRLLKEQEAEQASAPKAEGASLHTKDGQAPARDQKVPDESK